MQLVEVMVAAAVFASASGSSLQLFAQAAGSSQQTELRQQRLERIELDRLQLLAHWRRALAGGCAPGPEQLQALAAALPVPPQLQRELSAGNHPDELRMRWRFVGENAVVRQQLVTGIGIGGSCTAPGPLNKTDGEAGA